MLEIAQESAATIKRLEVKNKRLERAIEDMIEVGPTSNSDLRQIFQNLYTGLEKNKEKLQKPICHWENCTSKNCFAIAKVTLNILIQALFRLLIGVTTVNGKIAQSLT